MKKKLMDRRKCKLNQMIICSMSNLLDIEQNHDHAPNCAHTFQYPNTSLLQLPHFKIPAQSHTFTHQNTSSTCQRSNTSPTFQLISHSKFPTWPHTFQRPSISLMLQHCKTSHTIQHSSISYISAL